MNLLHAPVPAWRQPRGKSQVNLPQMLPPGGSISVGVETIYLPRRWGSGCSSQAPVVGNRRRWGRPPNSAPLT